MPKHTLRSSIAGMMLSLQCAGPALAATVAPLPSMTQASYWSVIG